SVDFTFAASTPFISFSVGNVYTDSSITIAMTARDANGNVAGRQQTTIPASGTRTFALAQLFPGLSRTQPASLEISNTRSSDFFVAEAVLDGSETPIYS